jgi:hypothetical protein
MFRGLYCSQESANALYDEAVSEASRLRTELAIARTENDALKA